MQLPAGMTGWLPAQQHPGENVGDTDTHVLFVELNDTLRQEPPGDALGPG